MIIRTCQNLTFLEILWPTSLISGTMRAISEIFSPSSTAKWTRINSVEIVVYFGLHCLRVPKMPIFAVFFNRCGCQGAHTPLRDYCTIWASWSDIPVLVERELAFMLGRCTELNSSKLTFWCTLA